MKQAAFKFIPPHKFQLVEVVGSANASYVWQTDASFGKLL